MQAPSQGRLRTDLRPGRRTSIELDRELDKSAEGSRRPAEQVAHLKKAKLVGSVVWADDQSLDVAHVDISAGHGQCYRSKQETRQPESKETARIPTQ